MNDRTDFGWFLYGSDNPAAELTNVSLSGGVFHATTGTNPNLFLLETGNPEAARLGKTGSNFPIDANTYRLFAIRMNINGSPQATLAWNRNNLWDGTQTRSGIFTLSPGWRTYLVDLPALGTLSGSEPWNGLIRSLQFSPSYLNPYNIDIDWIRLVNVNSALCRQVTWTGYSGAVDLYLVSGGVETLLASGVSNGGTSAGCSTLGSGYNFYAGALAAGTYQVRAKRAGSADATSSSSYVVNGIPLLTLTSPSEEGSSDDFATTVLGNAWDMNATSDVDQYFGLNGVPSITPVAAETPAGASLGSVQVYLATSAPAQPGLVGDPILQPLSTRGDAQKIDPTKYRILTVEVGIPNLARSMVNGSVARIAWRVAGGINYSVTDDIVINSRQGANVMDKINLDLADRSVLPIEPTSPSQLGWVPGSSGGIDRFRFDPHEFSPPTPFYVRRIKLAALERVNSGSNYTIQWTASENGTVTLYYDPDKNILNGNHVLIGSASASAGSFVWTAPTLPLGEYYIYAVVDDGQGNANAVYSKWPIVVGKAPPSAPPNIRLIF
jgi:hypothetical protein